MQLPLRIGMITGEYPPMQGGVGAFTQLLASEIAAQGQELYVLSRKATQSRDPQVHLTNIVRGWGLGSLLIARKWAYGHRLDVVNLQYQTAAYSMSPTIHFLPQILHPIPVVTTFHDLRFPYLFPKAGRLRDWIVMQLAHTSDGVISTNAEDAQRLIGDCTTLIPIGSNIVKAQHINRLAWRREIGAEMDECLIVFFGLISSSKGLDTLLQSLTLLRDMPLRLVIVGGEAGSSDPSNAAAIREIDTLIERLGLASVIHKTGFLEDEAVSNYLAAADIVALPFNDGASYRRGSLMAAIQHGCAIVSTRPQVAIPAFVDQQNMLLVPPRDPAALAEALRRLHKSPYVRAKLRQAASELAQDFQWPEIAQMTIDFYRRVVARRAKA